MQSCHKLPCKNDEKLVRELKGLETSVNYDGKTITSRKGRIDGRALLKNK